ncbi:hypothetical protein K440DRAFT_126433 [Wilcoxina mikolae CBS 423.85]|nr:hypothetical protein K440DRAFT_126433 [Wilcoxina mikolae CBS 423.85]
MVDYANPSYQFPTRQTAPPKMSINPHLTPRDPYGPPSASSSHSRRRTSSSGVFPAPNYDLYYGANVSHNSYAQQSYYPMATQKQRTNSSSTNTGGSISSLTNLRRSGSTNTTASCGPPATSYVAALRRQKATVWCEKSQPEDAQLIEAQRLAKNKAAQEVVRSPSSKGLTGGSHGLGSGSSSTSSSLRGVGRSHHKLGKGHTNTATIGAGSLITVLEPRLSATEANGDSSDEDGIYMGTHRRSDSGRSSLNSNHRKTMYPSGHRNSSASDIQRKTSGRSSSNHSPSISTTELSDPQQQQPRGKSKTLRVLEETSPDLRMDKAALKRSGSVDEREARTMTMSGLRLVVANPD